MLPKRQLFIAMLICLVVILAWPVRAQDNTISIPNPEPNAIYRIEWKPDSSHFIRYVQSFGQSSGVVIDAVSGEVIFDTGSTMQAAQWTADGSRLVLWGQDIAVFDGDSYEMLYTLPTAYAGAESLNGNLLLSASGEDYAVYDLQTGELEYTLPIDGSAWWSPDGTLLITSENATHIYDAATGELIAEHEQAITGRISPDNRYVIGTISNNLLPVYNLMTGELVSSIEVSQASDGCGSTLQAPQWSLDGNFLKVAVSADAVSIFDTATWQPIEQREAVRQSVWFGDAQRILTIEPENNAIVLRNVDGATNVIQISPDQDYIDWDSVRWSISENVLTLSSWDGQTTVWDLQSGNLIATVEHHVTLVACDVFLIPPSISPDGRHLVTYQGGDNILVVWEAGMRLISDGSDVAIYAEADSDSDLVVEVPGDTATVFDVLEVQNNLLRVTLPDGTAGWVNTLPLRPYLPSLGDNTNANMLIWNFDAE